MPRTGGTVAQRGTVRGSGGHGLTPPRKKKKRFRPSRQSPPSVVPLPRVSLIRHYTVTGVLCRAIASYIAVVSEILKGIENQWEIVPGETTGDGEMSLVTAFPNKERGRNHE